LDLIKIQAKKKTYRVFNCLWSFPVRTYAPGSFPRTVSPLGSQGACVGPHPPSWPKPPGLREPWGPHWVPPPPCLWSRTVPPSGAVGPLEKFPPPKGKKNSAHADPPRGRWPMAPRAFPALPPKKGFDQSLDHKPSYVGVVVAPLLAAGRFPPPSVSSEAQAHLKPGGYWHERGTFQNLLVRPRKLTSSTRSPLTSVFPLSPNKG